MGKNGCSGTFVSLFKQSGIISLCKPKDTVSNCFDVAFSVLKQSGFRDEYVYRAALTHKVLLGKHSLRTASMLTEFRTGACKADLVILNGTATAYEIKSERDSLSRLERQVANYKKVFAAVNVIASEDHIETVLKKVHQDIGVLGLSNRGQIQTIREAAIQPEKICPVTAFESLRSSEAKAILKYLGEKVPETPNTQLYSEIKKLFSRLDPEMVHESMVTVLKKSRNLTSLENVLELLPTSLHTATLSINVKRDHHSRIIKAVSTPLSDAMYWI